MSSLKPIEFSMPALPIVEAAALLRLHFPQLALFQQQGQSAYLAWQAQTWVAWDDAFIWSFDQQSGSWHKKRYYSASERQAYWQNQWDNYPDHHWMGYAQGQEGYWALYRYVLCYPPDGQPRLFGQGSVENLKAGSDLEAYFYQTPRKSLAFEWQAQAQTQPSGLVGDSELLRVPNAHPLLQERPYRGAAFSHFQQQSKGSAHSFFIETEDRQWSGQSHQLLLKGDAPQWERPLYLEKKPNEQHFAWTAERRFALDAALAELAQAGIKASVASQTEPLAEHWYLPLTFSPPERTSGLWKQFLAQEPEGFAGWIKGEQLALLPLLDLQRFLGKVQRSWPT